MPRKPPKKPSKSCNHPRWRFTPAEDGVRRKCLKCGFTVKEIGREVSSQMSAYNAKMSMMGGQKI